MAMRCGGSIWMSDSRVVTTEMPRAPSRDRSRTLNASVSDFSVQLPLCPPESSPPWAASSTTTKRAAGAAGACGGAGAWAALDRPVEQTASNSPKAQARSMLGNEMVLVQRIDGQAAEQLGIEVSGFLRHHLSGKGHFFQLLHRDRICEKRHVRVAASHLLDCLCGVAQVADIGLLANLFCIEAQQPLEHERMQLRQIELALPFRHVGQSGSHGLWFRTQQQCAAARDRDEGAAWLLLLQCVDVGSSFFVGQCAYGEECLSRFCKRSVIEIFETVHNAVRGQNHQAV